jgi:WD repeat-containing protein 48
MEIIGVSPIVRHSVLKNKMEVLTQDSMGAIALWDVSRPTPIRTFDGVTDGSDFEILLENESLNPDVVVPSWFTCNTRSGSLAITLSPSSAFNAEAYASDLGIADAAPDERRNLGVETIRLLMDEWVEKFTSSKPPRSTKRAFAEPLPSECAVSFAHPIDDSGRVCVKIREDFSGTPTERELLPKWFADHALNQAPEPESPKISFRLAPRAGSGLAEISPASVSAPKILGAQKIREYIAQKLDETDGGTSTDASALALWCAGQPVPSSATLAAALARVWKKSPPIELEYSN